tara:strand:- start:578 stop:811 length:234 start_codon:yes stop_codon:yes gene_type:complete
MIKFIYNYLPPFLVGLAVAWIGALTYIVVQADANKVYHCHAKKGFLLESLKHNSSIFVKVEPPMFCVNLDNKGGKKK